MKGETFKYENNIRQLVIMVYRELFNADENKIDCKQAQDK